MGIEVGLAALVGGLMASSMAKPPQMPSVPAVTQVDKPPQASKAPDRNAVAAGNAAVAGPGGPMSGNSGTFLTGPGGIDPNSLNLGKNTLLGQ